MMPAFMEAAATGGGVKWVRVDGNVASSIVKREDVRGFPTVFGVDFSGAVKQMNGPRDAQSLLQFAASLRAPEPEAKTVETEAVKDETA
jgi:thioredoxin-like negative regulator of GroEL